MAKPRHLLLALALVASPVTLGAVGGCKKDGGAAAGAASSAYAQADKPENLQGLLQLIISSAAKGDNKLAAGLTRGLLVDAAAAKKALKDDAPAEIVDAALKAVAGLPSDDAVVAKLLVPPPERTEVHVWASTTEDLAKYADGSVAFKEFPGGARKLAESALRPGVTFYEVEFVEPGKDSGMKYHLFFWDGAAWRMLGPAWRGLH